MTTVLRSAIREALRVSGGSEISAFKLVAKRWLYDETFREAAKSEVLELIDYPVGGAFSAIVDEAMDVHADSERIVDMATERIDVRENPTSGAEAHLNIERAAVAAIRRAVSDEARRNS